LPADERCVAQHFEVVRDSRLADLAAAREVTRADLSLNCQLPHDCQASAVCQRPQHSNVGIEASHPRLKHINVHQY
jgi:hypothetical protein